MTWRSWSGLTSIDPAEVRTPTHPDAVVEAVVAARDRGMRVKMVGSLHSFTDIAVTDGILLRPDGLVGIRSVDLDAMTVTVHAGTPLHVLNEQLTRLGLALHNMGDIDRQTVAGATATGTHGTGGRQASLSAQVAALELVTGGGDLVQARPDGTEDEATLLRAARVGLGALGIVTAVTFAVEPAFVLEAAEVPLPWSELLDRFEEHAAGNLHFEAYWFPHTDRTLTLRNNRADESSRPLSPLRRYVEDELLTNTAFGALNRIGDLAPVAIPAFNRFAARVQRGRSYTDTSHRVFVSQRRVRFREMEYAVPKEAGMAALREIRSLIERRGWRIGFPLEIRHAPRDDCWLSPAYDRDSVHISLHVNARTDHTTYFGEVERLFEAYDGRPHWGKLHTRTATELARTYPRFEEFVAVRDRVDPDRLFTNAYLDRVLDR